MAWAADPPYPSSPTQPPSAPVGAAARDDKTTLARVILKKGPTGWLGWLGWLAGHPGS